MLCQQFTQKSKSCCLKDYFSKVPSNICPSRNPWWPSSLEWQFTDLGSALLLLEVSTNTDKICNKVLIICTGFSDAHKSAIKCGFPDTIDTYGLVSGLWTSVFAFGAFVGEFVQVRMVLGWSHQDGITSFIVIRASGDWRCYPTHSIMFQDRPSEEFCMMQSPSAGPSSLSSSESSSPSSGWSGWRQSFKFIHYLPLAPINVMKTPSSSTLQSCGLPRLWDLPHGKAGVWEVNRS